MGNAGDVIAWIAACIVVCIVAVSLSTCTYYQGLNNNATNVKMMEACTASGGDWTTTLPTNYTYICSHNRGR